MENQDRKLAIKYAKAAKQLLEENKKLKFKLKQQAALIDELEQYKAMHEDIDPDLSIKDASYQAHLIVAEAKRESRLITDDLSSQLSEVLSLMNQLEMTSQDARKTTLNHYDAMDEAYQKIIKVLEGHLTISES